MVDKQHTTKQAKQTDTSNNNSNTCAMLVQAKHCRMLQPRLPGVRAAGMGDTGRGGETSESAASSETPFCQTPVGLSTCSMFGRALPRQPRVGSPQPLRRCYAVGLFSALHQTGTACMGFWSPIGDSPRGNCLPNGHRSVTKSSLVVPIPLFDLAL